MVKEQSSVKQLVMIGLTLGFALSLIGCEILKQENKNLADQNREKHRKSLQSAMETNDPDWRSPNSVKAFVFLAPDGRSVGVLKYTGAATAAIRLKSAVQLTVNNKTTLFPAHILDDGDLHIKTVPFDDNIKAGMIASLFNYPGRPGAKIPNTEYVVSTTHPGSVLAVRVNAQRFFDPVTKEENKFAVITSKLRDNFIKNLETNEQYSFSTIDIGDSAKCNAGVLERAFTAGYDNVGSELTTIYKKGAACGDKAAQAWLDAASSGSKTHRDNRRIATQRKKADPLGGLGGFIYDKRRQTPQSRYPH